MDKFGYKKMFMRIVRNFGSQNKELAYVLKFYHG